MRSQVSYTPHAASFSGGGKTARGSGAVVKCGWPLGRSAANCRLFGPALGMGTAEALPAWPLSSHKVVPHRRLLIGADESDIFAPDQTIVLEFDA